MLRLILAARDRLSEDVERHVADHARVPDIAAEVRSTECEVDLGVTPARFADELLHPLAPELVPVAVEEDVVLLLDGGGLEQLRIRSPEDRFRAPRTQLAQAVEPTLGVREHEVVLGRIGTVVVVEPRVHAAELGEAHRHVAVVEHDGHVEALTQPRRNAAQVCHRHGEDDHRCDITFLLEDALEMPLPAGRDVAPDRLACEPVAHRVFRVVLAAPKQRVAFQARGEPAGAREQLGFAVKRIGRRPPPRRFDCPPAVRSDDEVDADLVEALPDLPPGGRTAVTEVEVGRGRNREDLGCSCHAVSMANGCVGSVSATPRQQLPAACGRGW